MKNQRYFLQKHMAFWAVLLLGCCKVVVGQTYSELKEFTSSDGHNPGGRIVLANGVIYGATRSGGTNDTGTIFAVGIEGSAFVSLRQFTVTSGFPDYTNTDGAFPEGGLLLVGETLFGTSRGGGLFGAGTVFSLRTNGADFRVLKHFSHVLDYGTTKTNSDGAAPIGGLVFVDDVLYGTASQGGSAGNGTIFRINTDGTGFTVLKDYEPALSAPHTTNANGFWPEAALTGMGEFLYGTTYGGGNLGGGTIFQIKTNGMEYVILKHFADLYGPNYTNQGGAQPKSKLLILGDVIYGTTWQGGEMGMGTVFKLRVNGSGFTVLKNFSEADGGQPTAGLTSCSRFIYGTCWRGGSNSKGTIYRIDTNGPDFRVLHSFANDYPHTGRHPSSDLIYSEDCVIGTAAEGGGFNSGTIFKLDLALPLKIQIDGNLCILTWHDPAFMLQSSYASWGPFCDVSGAASPFTNHPVSDQTFFRLELP